MTEKANVDTTLYEEDTDDIFYHGFHRKESVVNGDKYDTIIKTKIDPKENKIIECQINYKIIE